MSKSARLRLRDLRAIRELTGECRDLGDDPVTWRQHWYSKVAGLIGAELALGGELTGLASGRPRALGTAEWGWERGFDRSGWLRALELMKTDPNYTLLFSTYGSRLRRQNGIALSVMDFLAERAWVGSVEYQEVYRPIGVYHNLWCVTGIPGTAQETNGEFFCRAAGGHDFTARQKAVLAEAQAAIGVAVGGALARFGEPSPTALPPRVRQVLRCLLEGDGDKQIAKRLGLSAYTVNEYVKRIFGHFGVMSRTELLARWVRRGWGQNGPGWADAP